MVSIRTKAAIRAALAAPLIRDGLRWFINEPAIPARWRDFAHRKVAKRARFGDRAFAYTTPDGVELHFMHTGTSNYLYWLNEYEPETTSLFCRLARSASVIMDIGAAEGVYSILASAVNRDARILAFEPGVDAAKTCFRNLALNQPFAHHVELYDFALADTDMESTLYVAGETGGTSSLNPLFRRQRREQRVTVRRADVVLSELGITNLDLIKIDTESTEPAVLRGCAEHLERHKPDIICEILAGRTEAEIETLLSPLGYRYYWITARGAEARERIVGDKTYRHPNYLFTVRSPTELVDSGVQLA
jgi:FkbM family methyltransferase